MQFGDQKRLRIGSRSTSFVCDSFSVGSESVLSQSERPLEYTGKFCSFLELDTGLGRFCWSIFWPFSCRTFNVFSAEIIWTFPVWSFRAFEFKTVLDVVGIISNKTETWKNARKERKTMNWNDSHSYLQWKKKAQVDAFCPYANGLCPFFSLYTDSYGHSQVSETN